MCFVGRVLAARRARQCNDAHQAHRNGAGRRARGPRVVAGIRAESGSSSGQGAWPLVSAGSGGAPGCGGSCGHCIPPERSGREAPTLRQNHIVIKSRLSACIRTPCAISRTPVSRPCIQAQPLGLAPVSSSPAPVHRVSGAKWLGSAAQVSQFAPLTADHQPVRATHRGSSGQTLRRRFPPAAPSRAPLWASARNGSGSHARTAGVP